MTVLSRTQAEHLWYVDISTGHTIQNYTASVCDEYDDVTI